MSFRKFLSKYSGGIILIVMSFIVFYGGGPIFGLLTTNVVSIIGFLGGFCVIFSTELKNKTSE